MQSSKAKTITIKKITLDKLKRYLEKIGWSIRGNDINTNIVNDYGELIVFYIDGDAEKRLKIRHNPFGRSFSGSFQLSLSEMWMQYTMGKTIGDTFLSLIFPKGNTTKGCKSFISFYPNKMRDTLRE